MYILIKDIISFRTIKPYELFEFNEVILRKMTRDYMYRDLHFSINLIFQSMKRLQGQPFFVWWGKFLGNGFELKHLI